METRKRTLASAAAVGLMLLASCTPRPGPLRSRRGSRVGQISQGVKGIPGGEGAYHTWNFFEWDKE